MVIFPLSKRYRLTPTRLVPSIIDPVPPLSLNSGKLIISFASQLERQGLWQQAIFVLLHLGPANQVG